jgi:hypothetical protein
MFRLTVILLFSAVLAPVPAAAADRARGEQLAVEHCRRCHTIPGENNMSVGNSPSFKAMVTSPADDWRYKFEVFYALRPHASFVRVMEFRSAPQYPLGIAPLNISLDDIPHLLTYVDSLAANLRR